MNLNSASIHRILIGPSDFPLEGSRRVLDKVRGLFMPLCRLGRTRWGGRAFGGQVRVRMIPKYLRARWGQGRLKRAFNSLGCLCHFPHHL